MKKIWRSLYLTILPLAILASFTRITTVKAQITPDNSLGAENSVVNPNAAIKGLPSDRIDGGAIRGANLFHSFQEFNVNAGRGAYFSNPAGIQNILSRVTGGNPSNILGTLGVLGNANLFFINPNGIIFGPNARLDVGGSFFASTANSLVFPNGFEFSATNPQAPPLLTVNIPIGLRFRDNPGEITVRGLGHEGFYNGELVGAYNSFDSPTLKVLPGETLALVGGNVNLDGGVLQSPRGRVELGGLAAAGVVEFKDGSFSYPLGVQLADVSLTNQAGINVIADAFGGGSININARNIGISGQSLLTAGIASNLGTVNNSAGNITLNATGETRIYQSRVENNVNFGTISNSGNINIQTGSFVLTNGAVLDASNLEPSGGRFAGDVRVDASDQVSLDQSSIKSDGFSGRVFLSSANNSVDISNSSISTPSNDDNRGSNFSQIKITAPQGSVFLNQATLSSTNSGTGFAGDVRVDASDRVAIANQSDIKSDGFSGRVFLSSANNSVDISNSSISTASNDDNRGSNFSLIQITAPQGSVFLNQATLSSTNSGTGFAGDIVLNARDLVSVTSPNPLGSSGNGHTIQSNGNRGRISIGSETSSPKVVELRGVSLSATNDSVPDTVKESINAGDISIYAQDKISFDNLSFIETLSRRPGNAGNVTLQANNGDISLANGSIIFNTIELGGIGNAGAINVTARNLSLTDGAQLQTLVRGASEDGKQAGVGNAGDIKIQASGDVLFAGSGNIDAGGNQGSFPSGVRSEVQPGASGNAGNINIQARSIFLSDSAEITSQNNSNGSAGVINLNALDQVSLKNRSTISSDGELGLIFIGRSNPNTPSPIPSSIDIDNSTLTTTNSGTGFAGDIRINSRDQISISDSDISSQGRFGRILIGPDPNDQSSSPTPSSVQINSSNLRTDNTTAPDENAGPININAGKVVINKGELSSTTYGSGNAGDILVLASGSVEFVDNALFSNVVAGATNTRSGDITINAGFLSLEKGAQLQSSVTGGQGKGGNVMLNVQGDLTIAGFNQDRLPSAIFTNVKTGASGDAGNINIRSQAGSIFLDNNARLYSTNNSDRLAGDIVLNARDQVTLSNSTISSNGNFGRIFIGKNNVYSDVTSSPKQVNLNGSTLSTKNSSVTGDPDTQINVGEISIDALNSISLVNKSTIDASTTRRGNAGSVTLQANNGDISLADGSYIFSTIEAGGRGDARSEINVTARNLSLTDGAQLQTLVRGASQDGEQAGVGNAGNIGIQASGDVLFAGSGNIDAGGNEGSFPSGVRSEVQPGASGNAGNINIQARSIFLSDTAEINSQNNSNSFAGDIVLNARDQVTLANSTISSNGNFGRIFIGKNNVYSDVTSSPKQVNLNGSTLSTTNSSVTDAPDTPINAGNISIDALDRISLMNGSTINAFTTRYGNAGDVTLQANNGEISLADGSAIFSGVERGAIGQGGNIDVTARSLFLSNSVALKTSLTTSLTTSTLGLAGNDFRAKAGSIQVNVSDSLIASGGAQLRSDTFGEGDAGNITIKAGNVVSFDGASSGVFSSVGNDQQQGLLGKGTGGNLDITAKSLTLTNGAQINASTSGVGNAGRVRLQAQNGDISLSGAGSSVFSYVANSGIGKGGDIDIQARNFSLTGGAELIAQTFGNGNAGNINVNTTDSIFLSGVAPYPVFQGDPGGFSSGLFTNTEKGANGQGGEINITTPKLQISDGAVLSARSRSDFKGGDITVNANTLEVTGGGQLLTTSFTNGDAGSITIKADRINLSGSDRTFSDRKNQVAQVFGQAQADFTIDPVSSESGIFANTGSDSTAKGGTLTINTQDLRVENGATIAVNSPKGQAGNLNITAKTIRLDRGSLTAETAISPPNQSGANINLQGLDLLFLRNNSRISAQATTDTANGGNITIDAKNGFVVATSGGNDGSDIIANASLGRGGNINITSQSVFGLAKRRATPGNRTNDIDASSQADTQQGTVNINSPDVDPSRGLIELPENVVDPTRLIAQNPCQQGAGSAFIITGRGGLPSNPNQALTSDNVRVDLVTPAASRGNSATTTVKPSTTSTVKQIVPAQGWVFNDKGQVVLTAYDPTKTGSQRSWQQPASCAKR